MVRVIIKGGVWRNTEDEILKAAIMKYGKNQWSRIASLLHRKSAKQCKARWYEWLDPGIKKTEWSRTEDEKLLHLAKLMPTQWRTIAPIVGRTAAQCLERYEHLLDEAQKKAEQMDETEDLNDARKLRPGEIDPTPETKPARPDPIDMDEDELEMLSEARARLANTQGKKAKRKAREKQLSEARRLASLQKRRELRAAGIPWGQHKFQRRNPLHLDYSAEIPFEKPVPPGFYDPSEDKFEKDTTFKKQTRAEIEGVRRDDVENEERKKDREKLKKRRSEGNPESVFEQKVEKKRSKLILPTPQISDKEMEEIVKIGQATDTIREFSDSNPTSTLLHDYQMPIHENTARTARTPSMYADALQKEAENLLALQNAPTPLKGGVNTPLHDLNLQSALPQDRSVATPNTVLANIAATPLSVLHGTPGQSEPPTPSGTPFRDQLSINNPQLSCDSRSELKKALSSLPAPRNEFVIMVPPDENEASQEETSDWVEDASDVSFSFFSEPKEPSRALGHKNTQIPLYNTAFVLSTACPSIPHVDAQKVEELELLRLEKLKKESQVIQRGLPKPSRINEQSFKPISSKSDIAKADDVIKTEMFNILKHDVDEHPIDDMSLEDLEEAENMIRNELRPEEHAVLNANLWAVIEQCSSELILAQNKFTRLGVLPKKDQIDALSAKFQLYREWMNIRAKKTAKMEKKLKVKLAGYQSIGQHLIKLIEEVRAELEACKREKATFELLEENEKKAIRKRLNKLTEEVTQQEKREKELQKRYDELMQEKWNIGQALVRMDATITAQPVTYQ
uniref:Cell division cycle 5-like protein n=1 Tax=Setaria digitata TaxID=48799 RepID=A0A915PGV6_9BILA